MNILLLALGIVLGVPAYLAVGSIASRLAWWAWPLKGPRTVIRFLFFPMNVSFDLFPETITGSDPPLILSNYFENGTRDEYVVASAWLWPLRLIWLPIGCALASYMVLTALLGLTAKHVASHLKKAYKTLVTPSFRRKKKSLEEPPLSSASRSLPIATSVDLRVPQTEDQTTSQPA